MALERSVRERLERAGAVPRPLVVGIEGFAQVVQANAAWRADAAGGRDEFPFPGHADTPAAIVDLAGERAGEAENDPHVAVRIGPGAKGVLVVVAGDAPAVVDRLENVGTVVTVDVLHAGQLAALGAVEPTVREGEVERLVQALGIEGPLDFVRRTEWVGQDVDIAAAAADGQFAVGEHLDAAGLHHDTVRHRDGVDLVIVGLDRVGGARGGRLAKREPGQQCEACHLIHHLEISFVFRG